MSAESIPVGSTGKSSSGSAGVPYVPASQASALLRSGLAIAVELMQQSMPSVCRAVVESISGRWDMDVGAPLVHRMLMTKAAPFQHDVIEHLRMRQDVAVAALQRRPQEQNKTSVDAEALTLVEADSVRSMTLVERTANRMFSKVEEHQRDLNFIVGFLVGRSHVRSVENPFSPDIFVAAVVQAAESQQLHAEAFEYLLHAFEKPLAEEVGRIHVALLDHFRNHKLDPVAIRRSVAPKAGASSSVLPSVTGKTPAASVPRGALGAGPVAGGSGLTMPGDAGFAAPDARTDPLPLDPVARPAAVAAALGAPQADPGFVLNDLLQRLQISARDLRAPAMPTPGPAGPMLLGAINELQQLGLDGFHGAAFAGTGAGSINAWREHLVEKSTRTVDKLTIELVGMLFDHVLQDKQVPAEIKALLSRMQFPVLKAALLDADFFASGTHPARRLIDRVAATAIGWEPYGDENERYRAEVEKIVREVLEQFDKDVGVFERLLTQFDEFIAEIPPKDSDPVARAKRALEEAEKREILVINTTIQVRRAFEKVELEPYLRDFLVGPWVQVLVSAAMRDGETPGFSKRFREVIHDVVWSVQPKGMGEDRRRLVELIPRMMRILRDGLALIRMPEREQDEFFNQLMQSHAMAVKPVDQATYIKASLQSSELRASVEGMHLTANAPITTVAGGIRVSTGAVMKVAREHNAEFEMPELATDIANLDRVEEAGYDEEIARWPRGTWFTLWNGKERVKARLRWISPLRTLFLFSTDQEKSAHVMPPHVIKSYLKKGWLKAIEQTPLTRRAVDGVVSEFEKMPKRRDELASRYAVTVS
jgi:hypothetical protein